MQSFLEYVNTKKIDKKLIDQFGKYKVYTVNGSQVRKLNLDAHAFMDYSIHDSYPKMIPPNEIWIDDITKGKERWLAIHSALYRIKLINRGQEKNSYDKALKMEKKRREILDGIKFNPKGKPPKDIYYKLYGTIEGCKVWLVDGEKVRDIYKTDFVEGGNSGPYPWIPKNEIWIEKNMHEKEMPLIILHEFVELMLMKYKKLTYDKAHNIADKVEFHHENNFTKEQALSLTCKKALNLASEYQ